MKNESERTEGNFYQCKCLFLGCNFFNGVIYWSWNEKCPDIKCHFYLSPTSLSLLRTNLYIFFISWSHCKIVGVRQSFLLNLMQWLLANWLHFCSHITMLTCNFRLLHNIKSTISVLVIFLALLLLSFFWVEEIILIDSLSETHSLSRTT